MASAQAYDHVQNPGHGPLPSLAWAYYWDAVQGQDWDAVALAISVMRGVRSRAWTCIGLKGKTGTPSCWATRAGVRMRAGGRKGIGSRNRLSPQIDPLPPSRPVGPQLASRSFAKKNCVKIGKCPSRCDVSAGKLAIFSLEQCFHGDDSQYVHTPKSLTYVAPGNQGHYITTRWI